MERARVVKKHSNRDESRYYDYDHPDEMPPHITHEVFASIHSLAVVLHIHDDRLSHYLSPFPRLIFNCAPPTRIRRRPLLTR